MGNDDDDDDLRQAMLLSIHQLAQPGGPSFTSDCIAPAPAPAAPAQRRGFDGGG